VRLRLHWPEDSQFSTGNRVNNNKRSAFSIVAAMIVQHGSSGTLVAHGGAGKQFGVNESEQQMETKTVESGTGAGNNLSQAVLTKLDDVVDEGKRKARRVAKRGYARAEEYLEDTTYCIKRHPWETVGFTLGAGAMLGMLCGWCCARLTARR
jgi:ElaB/YqjD/DUF883 family membrane-anchored ribosome-binding protein